MATTRNNPAPDPAPPPEGGGFSPEQKSELTALIAEAVGSAKPPGQDPTQGGPKPVSDDDWDKMTDRARESWVRQLVDFRLDELAKEDDDARLRQEVEALKAAKTVEPEATPSVITKLQKFLWGAEREKS